MSSRPWMKLYTSDFIGDTAHLSTEAIGAYMLLLMVSWNLGGKLPDDDEMLARVCHATPQKWTELKAMLSGLFEISNGVWTNHRLLQEWMAAEDSHSKRVSAGLQGGRGNKKAMLPAMLSPKESNATSKAFPKTKLSFAYQIPEEERECERGKAKGEKQTWPVEPPPGFPSNEHEAEAQAAAVGVPPDYAVTLWNEAVGSGFRTSRGAPIANFARWAKGCFNRKTSAEAERHANAAPGTTLRAGVVAGHGQDKKASPGGVLWRLRETKQAAESERQELRNKHTFEDAMGRHWNTDPEATAARERVVELNATIKDCNRRIADLGKDVA